MGGRNLSPLTLFCLVISCFTSLAIAEGDPIVIKGSHFFYSNGSEFFIRGVYYHDSGGATPTSSTFIDSLGDISRCRRDLPYLLQLGINTLYLNSIDVRANHSGCMQLLQAAGIYVIVNVNGRSAPTYISIDNGRRQAYWDYTYLESVSKVIDTFHQYPNTLAFSVNIPDSTIGGMATIPWVKMLVKDVKDHISKMKYRSIPVGSTAHEHRMSRVPQYMNCGDRNSSVDFLGLEIGYSRKKECPEPSSWLDDGIVEEYRGYSIPSYFFYGCTVKLRKNFEEVQSIFSNATTEVFSGGIVHEWLEDWDAGADLGLVEVKGDSVYLRPGYSALSSQLGMLQASSTKMSLYTPTNTAPPVCQNFTSQELWEADKNATTTVAIATNLPSKPSERLCTCMMDTLGCALDQNANITSAETTWKGLCRQNLDWCHGEKWNASTGVYGSYSGCSLREKISWTFNQFSITQGDPSATCESLGGIAKQPIIAGRQASDCQIFLEQAGPQGLGTITVTPTARPSEPGISPRKGKGALVDHAKIGISVGVVSVVLAIVSATFVLCFRARMKRKSMVAKADNFGKTELEGQSASSNRELPLQLDSSEVRELEGVQTFEIDCENQLYELSSPEVADGPYELESHPPRKI